MTEMWTAARKISPHPMTSKAGARWWCPRSNLPA